MRAHTHLSPDVCPEILQYTEYKKGWEWICLQCLLSAQAPCFSLHGSPEKHSLLSLLPILQIKKKKKIQECSHLPKATE